MIRFYPNGYINARDPFGGSSKSDFYLLKNPRNPDLCIVYNTKEDGGYSYGKSLFAFYSPTLQRWLKGGLSGASVRDTLILATMDTENEAILIAEGCSGLTVGSEEFKMKMFLLAGEVIEKEEDLPPPPPPPAQNYLDELSDEYDVDPSDWVEVSRKPCHWGGEFVHLTCDEAEVEIFAQVTNDILGEYRPVGPLSFNLMEVHEPQFSKRSDGNIIVAAFAFNDEGQDLECDWVLEHHYGLDMSDIEEVSDGQFVIDTDDDIETVKARLTAMGAVYGG